MPLMSSTAKVSQNNFDRANTIMQIPNIATDMSSFFPCAFFNGNAVSNTITITDPISDAALSHPNPMGPTFKISFAKTGIIATAPPNKTANKSSVSAPNNSLV